MEDVGVIGDGAGLATLERGDVMPGGGIVRGERLAEGGSFFFEFVGAIFAKVAGTGGVGGGEDIGGPCFADSDEGDVGGVTASVVSGLVKPLLNHVEARSEIRHRSDYIRNVP